MANGAMKRTATSSETLSLETLREIKKKTTPLLMDSSPTDQTRGLTFVLEEISMM